MMTKMTRIEKQAVFSLSSIMALRMIGLFMVLPVFALYAQQLEGATPTLVGIAMGVYGLSQGLLQIPFGSLSDRFGRKPIILIGLIIFSLGSLLAGCAHSITWMIIGRLLQGAGAVSSTMLAMMADLTREEQRTKSMAIAGISIGFSFMVAMMLGPVLTKWFSVGGLFYVATGMGLVNIVLLYTVTPSVTGPRLRGDDGNNCGDDSVRKPLFNPQLLQLIIGIFVLHAIFTACFVAFPIGLKHYAHLESSQQWIIYLPTLIIASIISLILIGIAERKKQIKAYFIISIAMLTIAQLILWVATNQLMLIAIGLGLFFTGFSVLEAFLPSLVSRAAPSERKGSTMGLFSCAQFLGIFAGGVLGGWLYGTFSFSGVYLFCFILALCWLALSTFAPQPDFIRRKEQLQSE